MRASHPHWPAVFDPTCAIVSDPGLQLTARRVAGGVAWIYAGSALVIIAQVVYTALTARVLAPSEFGAYASAQALIALVGYFSLSTLGNTLTRMPAVSQSIVGTALTLAAGAGAGSALAALLLAGVWADAWHTPDASLLIALWAPAIVFSSLAVVPIGLLRRRLRYASAAGIESVSPVVGFVVGGVLVIVLRSPSALVVGQVVTAATMLALGLVACRTEIGLAFSRRDATGLLSFSGQVSGQNLAHYGFYTLPGLVIARTSGSAALGFFSRANLAVMLPMNFVNVGISKTLYPVLPQLTDAESRRRALSDVLAVGTYLVWPMLGLLAGFASIAVRLLFGPGWDPAAAMIAPLCLFAAANLGYVILASATESIGWLRVGWSIQGAWAIGLVVITVVAWQLGAGVSTFLYGYAVAQIGAHVVQVGLLSRRGLVSLRNVCLDEFAGGAMALFAFAVSLGVTESTEGSPLLVRLAAVALVAVANGFAMILVLPHVAAGRTLARRGLLPKGLRRIVRSA